MADPISAFIVKVVTAVGASQAAATSIAAFLTGKTFLTIATLAVSTAIQRRQLKGLQDNIDLKRDVLIRSATEAKKIVYGQTLVGGVVVYSNVAGTSNSSLFTVVAHAGHACESVTDIWLDDNVVAEADNPWDLGTAVTGGTYYVGSPPNEGVAAFSRGSLGLGSQVADPVMVSTFSDWTTNHRGRGICWTISQLVLKKKSEKVFESGAPSKIRALIKGKKCYDPDADSSPGADMIANGFDSTTYKTYTNNPIRCILDYLIDPHLGYGIDPSRIDWDSMQDEIDYCNFEVYNSSGDREKRFTMNGVLSTFDTHRSNLDRMLSSCNGSLYIKDGKYGVRASRYGFDSPTVGAIANGDAALGTTTTVSGNYRITNGASGGGFARGVRAITTEIGKRYAISAWGVGESGGGAFLFGVSNNSDGSSTFVSTSDSWVSEQQYRIEFVATATTTYAVFQNNSATNNAYVEWRLDEYYAVTDVTITADWLRDGFAVQSQDSNSELFNVAKAFYPSPDESYKMTQALEVTNSALISEYGETLTTEFNLPFTDSEDEAQRLAFKRILLNSQVMSVTLPCNYLALDVAVHDRVMVTIPEVGWTQRTFVVEQVTLVDAYGGVDLLLREDTANGYADPDVADYSARSPTGVVTWANPTVPAPSSVTLLATDATTMQIDWEAPEPTEFWDWCEVWRNTVNNSGTATLLYKGKNESYTDANIIAGTDYYYWVRCTKGDEESAFVATSPATSTAAAIIATSIDWSNVNDDGAGIGGQLSYLDLVNETFYSKGFIAENENPFCDQYRNDGTPHGWFLARGGSGKDLTDYMERYTGSETYLANGSPVAGSAFTLKASADRPLVVNAAFPLKRGSRYFTRFLAWTDVGAGNTKIDILQFHLDDDALPAQTSAFATSLSNNGPEVTTADRENTGGTAPGIGAGLVVAEATAIGNAIAPGGGGPGWLWPMLDEGTDISTPYDVKWITFGIQRTSGEPDVDIHFTLFAQFSNHYPFDGSGAP